MKNEREGMTVTTATENDKSLGAGGTPRPERKRKEANKTKPPSQARQIVGYYLELCRNPAKDLKAWIAETDRKPDTIKAERGPRGRVQDYLDLCKNPAANIPAWIDETRKAGGHGFNYRQGPKAGTVPEAGAIKRLYKNSLCELCLRLDKDESGRRPTHNLFTRQGTNLLKPNRLQPVRGSGAGGRSTSAGNIAALQTAKPQHTERFNNALIAAAGENESRRYGAMIAAIKGDKTKTAADRAALIATLRQQQAEAVAKARAEAMEQERARRAALRLQRPAKQPPPPDDHKPEPR